MQEMGEYYYKLHRRYDLDSEGEDTFEAEERIKRQEEEERAKAEYFKMIAEEEERGYYRQTESEMIEERSSTKKRRGKWRKRTEKMMKKQTSPRKITLKMMKKSKKDHSLKDEGSDGTQKTEEGAPDPADSFNPQEDDMTGVQEISGQSHTTKVLDELEEVETAPTSRSTKESNYTEQVIMRHFEEKKDDEDDKKEGSGKKPTLRAYKWLSWLKKRWPASGDLQSKVKKDKEMNTETEPDKDPDEADKKPDKHGLGDMTGQPKQRTGSSWRGLIRFTSQNTGLRICWDENQGQHCERFRSFSIHHFMGSSKNTEHDGI